MSIVLYIKPSSQVPLLEAHYNKELDKWACRLASTKANAPQPFSDLLVGSNSMEHLLLYHFFQHAKSEPRCVMTFPPFQYTEEIYLRYEPPQRSRRRGRNDSDDEEDEEEFEDACEDCREALQNAYDCLNDFVHDK